MTSRLLLIGIAVSISASCTDATDPARVATVFSIVGGNGQSVIAGAAVTNPFVVEVLDQNAKGLGGVIVTWTITAGGGSLSSTTSITDSAGLASTRYRAGASAGSATVNATVPGLSTVTFSTTITSGAAPIAVMRRERLSTGDPLIRRHEQSAETFEARDSLSWANFR